MQYSAKSNKSLEPCSVTEFYEELQTTYHKMIVAGGWECVARCVGLLAIT
jgi:hypothetical protein